MNVSISYFAQRLSASLMVCVLFLSLITSCAQTAKDEKTSENIIYTYQIIDLMYNRPFTPDMIRELKPNEIFVFGSNLAGEHSGGAAHVAYENLQGNGYGKYYSAGGFR